MFESVLPVRRVEPASFRHTVKKPSLHRRETGEDSVLNSNSKQTRNKTAAGNGAWFRARLSGHGGEATSR